MSDTKPHYLVNETIELINNRSVKIKMTDIANGTNIPLAWVSLFAKGTINEPSANRVLKIYEFMTGNNIKELLASQN